MKDDWMPKTIRGKDIKPAFCQDQNDFHKLFFAEVRANIGYTPDDLPYILFGTRLLLHEYLGLVLEGKLDPYEVEKEAVDREMEGFKETMNHINEVLVKAGVPVKEGENGKVVFDYEELRKRAGDIF